jgi:hypothetical protein
MVPIKKKNRQRECLKTGLTKNNFARFVHFDFGLLNSFQNELSEIE